MAPREVAYPSARVAEQVARVFADAQITKAGHRKHFLTLRRLHLAAVKGSRQSDFNAPFVACVNKVLAAAPTTAPAIERLLDFIPAFVGFCKDKDKAEAKPHVHRSDETPSRRLSSSVLQSEDAVEESFVSIEFAVWLIGYLLNGVSSRNKTVRLRCVRLVYNISSHLSSIDEELFSAMKTELSARILDREPAVRKEIVNAVAVLQSAENEDDEDSICKRLIAAMTFDPSPLVRRAAVAQVASTRSSAVAIVERCRDIDAATRKTALKQLGIRFLSYRDISSSLLASALDSGCCDTDESTRQCCAELISQWINGSIDEMANLLVKINVLSHLSAAENIVLGTFKEHPTLYENLSFNNEYWQNLSPETALILRCAVQSSENIADSIDVSTVGFHLQVQSNNLIMNPGESEEIYHFIVKELLTLALKIDYSDTLGRSKMFSLVRSMLGKLELNENLIPMLLELLMRLCIDERDFIRVVNEVISDINDSNEINEQSAEDKIYCDYHCITIVNNTLKISSVGWRNDAFAPMRGLLNELILPAFTKYSDYFEIITRAIECLGLVCLTTQAFTKTFFGQFLGYAGHPCEPKSEQVPIVETSLKVMLDLLYVFNLEALELSETALSTVEKVLADSILSPDPSISKTGIFGCVRLFLVKKLDCPLILASLLLQYFALVPVHVTVLQYFMDMFQQTFDDYKFRIAKVFNNVIEYLVIHNSSSSDTSKIFHIGSKLVSMIGEQPLNWRIDTVNSLLTLAADETCNCKAAIQICAKINIKDATEDDALTIRQKLDELSYSNFGTSIKKIDSSLSVYRGLKRSKPSKKPPRNRQQRVNSKQQSESTEDDDSTPSSSTHSTREITEFPPDELFSGFDQVSSPIPQKKKAKIVIEVPPRKPLQLDFYSETCKHKRKHSSEDSE